MVDVFWDTVCIGCKCNYYSVGVTFLLKLHTMMLALYCLLLNVVILV